MPLLQIETTLQHPDAIDDWLLHNDWDRVAIFDIDCIPIIRLTEFFDSKFCVGSKDIIWGAAQQANHIKGSEIYASPAFIVFTKIVYKKLLYPSFNPSDKGDVGYLITERASHNVDVELIWPTHVEIPKWDLGLNSCFGHGTTYDNKVYHAFESRMGNDKIFVKKCKEVLSK